MTEPIVIRPAQRSDQSTIRTLVWAARLYPFHLRWPHFIVAEYDKRCLVGAGQIRPYRDGCRELASLVVSPAFQKQGIASKIIRALLGREGAPIYLMCLEHMEQFYVQFGFRYVAAEEAPLSLRGKVWMGNRFSSIYGLLQQHQTQIIIMKWQKVS